MASGSVPSNFVERAAASTAVGVVVCHDDVNFFFDGEPCRSASTNSNRTNERSEIVFVGMMD